MRSVEELIELHRAWWKLENEKPILNIVYREHFPWMWMQSDHACGLELVLKDGSLAKDGPLTPEMLSPEKMHMTPFTHGDLFLPVMPFGKIPWMEAICGVTPQVSVRGNSIWGGFGQGIWPEDWWRLGLEPEVNKDWLNLLIETTKYCVEKFSNHFVVAQTSIMRGPVDIMAALVGDRNVITGMYRHPEETKRLLNRLCEICIMVMKAQNDVIPSFMGGYVNCWGIWAPGTVTRNQEDGAAYLSPGLYREFVQPVDRKIAQAFDYTTIHFHSSHHMHMDAVTDIPELGAVQLNLEPPPYGPTLKEWIPILKRVIRKKPLILQAWYLTREQIEMILNELPPQGLCLDTYVQEAGESYYVYRE
ncbi:MAG: uroporphyrinogen decarboxylase family protein [Candidatus Bathyarchaeia archaeon]